jgi:hypothetical protein
MEQKRNAFIDAVNFQATTLTENGAKAFSTTNSTIVDQFGKAGNYRNRPISDVFNDQEAIWKENKEAALRFPFYLRMVTRKIKINDNNITDKVQNGQGSRDEAFKRFLWIALNDSDAFYKNAWIIPLVGSWKDMWTLMFYDIKENINTLEHKAIFNIIANGLACETHLDLVKKFMPRIKSKSKCKTDWTKITNNLAKEFAEYMGIDYREYNRLKTSGKAHDFQKIICAREYDKINWNQIPGRALNLLVTSKFLENHNLKENYKEWILKQPLANFTGYVFELAKKVRKTVGTSSFFEMRSINREIPIEIKHTIDAQFMKLVNQARENGRVSENVLVALDTSGSMRHHVNGLKDVTCGDIATSLALFFSELNEGAFHHKIVMFDNISYPFDFKSDSFCENVMALPGVPCGGTNFQSVIEEIVKIRTEHPEVPLEDYPKTLLVVSDMHFNPCNYHWGRNHPRYQECNLEFAKETLYKVFPKEFVDDMKFIWWDCASRGQVFEGNAFESGVTFLSGFDGSIINTLLGMEKVFDEETKEYRNPTAEELVEKALSQEILNYISF